MTISMEDGSRIEFEGNGIWVLALSAITPPRKLPFIYDVPAPAAAIGFHLFLPTVFIMMFTFAITASPLLPQHIPMTIPASATMANETNFEF